MSGKANVLDFQKNLMMHLHYFEHNAQNSVNASFLDQKSTL